jgi:hypothetical protein
MARISIERIGHLLACFGIYMDESTPLYNVVIIHG